MQKKKLTILAFCILFLLQLPLFVSLLQHQQELRQQAKQSDPESKGNGGNSQSQIQNKPQEEHKEQAKQNITKAIEQGNGKKVGIYKRITPTVLPRVTYNLRFSVSPTGAIGKSGSPTGTPVVALLANNKATPTPSAFACTIKKKLTNVTVSCTNCAP